MKANAWAPLIAIAIIRAAVILTVSPRWRDWRYSGMC